MTRRTKTKDAGILHLWETHVGDPTEQRPLTEQDKIAFARAVLYAEREAAHKRPRGRPEVPPEQRLLAGSVRLTKAQWDKLELLGGGDWLRKKIDAAKVK